MDFVIKPFITSPQPLSTPLPVTMAKHVTDTPVRRPMDKDEKMYTSLLSLFSSNADACANCRLFVYVYDLLVKRGLTRTRLTSRTKRPFRPRMASFTSESTP